MMSPSSIFLVLTSAIIHIGWNTLTKSSSNPKVFSFLKGTVIAGIALIFFLFIPLRAIPGTVWIYIFVSGVVHALYIFALSTAYETGDISYVYPIVRSAPAFIPVAAFLAFEERISVRGGIGIVIVVLCIVILQLRGETKTDFTEIVRFLKKRERVWAFVTLGTVISYSLVDKAGMLALKDVNRIPANMHGLIFFLTAIPVSYVIYGGYMLRNRRFADMVVWKREWLKGILAAVGTISSYVLILHVMKTENLSYIVTLRQSSILFAVLIGWIVLREKQGVFRLITSIIMIAGLYLVATG